MGSWATGPGLPQCFQHDFCFLNFSCCSSLGWRGAGVGGDKNVIQIPPMHKTLVCTEFSPLCTPYGAKLSQASMPLASMPKTLVFAACSPLCTAYCARMWARKRCRKRPCFSRGDAQNFGIYIPRFCLFVQHTAQGCGTRKAVTSVHAFGDEAQHTGIYSIFASLHSILRD